MFHFHHIQIKDKHCRSRSRSCSYPSNHEFVSVSFSTINIYSKESTCSQKRKKQCQQPKRLPIRNMRLQHVCERKVAVSRTINHVCTFMFFRFGKFNPLFAMNCQLHPDQELQLANISKPSVALRTWILFIWYTSKYFNNHSKRSHEAYFDRDL